MGCVNDLADNRSAMNRVHLNGYAFGNHVYDGNVTMDGRRGVTIRYNELSLPLEISDGVGKISYIYSATGQKLAQQVGSSLTYYRDVMVYNGNALAYIIHPAGMTRKVSTGYVYDYYLSPIEKILYENSLEWEL